MKYLKVKGPHEKISNNIYSVELKQTYTKKIFKLLKCFDNPKKKYSKWRKCFEIS